MGIAIMVVSFGAVVFEGIKDGVVKKRTKRKGGKK